MSNTREGWVALSPIVEDSPAVGPARLPFMDNVRSMMIVLVVLYHAVAAFATVAPHWPLHDTSTLAADVIRELLDVFIMPALFFAAGYFALPSLRKRGSRSFIVDKAKRLLVPWALAMFVVLPLALYDQPVKPVRPFWRYWLSYVGSFQVHLRPTQTSVTVATQSVYWFVSLLFTFFLLFAVGYAVSERWRGRAAGLAPRAASDFGRPVLAALIVFGVLMSAVYFASLLLVPDSSWFMLSAFLEFQVTRLALFAGCFALGAYAQSRGWFADGATPGPLAVWTVLAVVLSVAFLVFGLPMFSPSPGAVGHPAAYLLAFAILRSFLLLSVLVVLLFGSARFWNRASWLDTRLASTSYDIYLVHLFIVVGLQEALVKWAGGPAVVKIAIVFLAGLSLSFVLARWVLGRYPRAFATGILALFALCLVIRP